MNCNVTLTVKVCIVIGIRNSSTRIKKYEENICSNNCPYIDYNFTAKQSALVTCYNIATCHS